MPTKNEVAEAKNTLPAEMFDNLGTNTGFEEAGVDDYAIPFINILQKGSPQVDEEDPGHVEGAKAGMILNTVTGEMIPGTEGITVIPCAFKKEFVEWKPRNQGGGFVATYPPDSGIDKQCTRNEFNQLVLENGNLIVDTRYHYVMLVDNATGTVDQAVIPMTSTQSKKSRKWMSTMATRKVTRSDGSMVQAPTFAFTYQLTTIGEKNEKGSWHGWSIAIGEQVTDADVFRLCVDFNDKVNSGEIKAKEVQSDDPSTDGLDLTNADENPLTS